MKREAKELNNLIEQVSQKVIDKVVNEKYLVSRMAVIVNEFDPNTNSASIIIPTDLSNHTDYKYPNRTGMTSLRSTVWENGQIKTYGDKVYLVYQSNNISQGWLESNKSLDIVKEVSRDYLTKADAADTYETKTHAADTYETKADAADTYETKADAADTYETKTDASNTYVKKSGDTMTGVLHIKASGWNARASAIDTVHNGEVDLAFGTNHTDHGVYSTGYSADGTTWTNGGKWLIYRTSGDKVRLSSGKATIDSNGNFRTEGYGSFGGYAYVDGGQVISGTSTLSSHDTYVICRSIAGDIFFKCGTSATANKWLSVKNNAGTYKDILSVDQSNNVTFQTGFSVNGGVYLSGNLTADGSDIHAGNTTKARTVYNGVHSIAGKLFLTSGNAATSNRQLNVMNNAGSYKTIIDIDQNNVAKFHGILSDSIATVTATLVSSANFTTLNYPSGFTVSNSVIINWAINTGTASKPAWATGHGLASGSDRTFVQQNNSNILFYNNQSAYYGKTVRVVLMKIG